jgi:hypothetical protein
MMISPGRCATARWRVKSFQQRYRRRCKVQLRLVDCRRNSPLYAKTKVSSSTHLKSTGIAAAALDRHQLSLVTGLSDVLA